MKKYICTLGLIIFTMSLLAQSKSHKLGLTFGGGSQKYNGDLGNGFTFKNEAWYGNFLLNAGYYLNKSFDVGVSGTIGDYGYCQSEAKRNEEVTFSERCPGCGNRLGNGNLNSRLITFGFNGKYKLANGYLLSSESAIKPYIYAGVGVNRIIDIMKMNCVREGVYFSVNAGVGVKYYISDRINIGYNLGFGYFTEDNLDNKVNYGKDMDMFMQNSLTVGIDLF